MCFYLIRIDVTEVNHEIEIVTRTVIVTGIEIGIRTVTETREGKSLCVCVCVCSLAILSLLFRDKKFPLFSWYERWNIIF